MVTGEKLDRVLDALRGAGEETRLRILHALSRDELAVSELTQVLAQSQPRISRHLKLMSEAGLIERRREGSWAFFRLTRDGFPARLALFALDALEIGDSVLDRDRERLQRVRARRADLAEAYFEENAGHWDKLRSMHAPEAAVEAAARRLFKPANKRTSWPCLMGRAVPMARFCIRFSTSSSNPLKPSPKQHEYCQRTARFSL